MTVKTLCDQLVEKLPKRQREVVVYRFGLKSQKPKTLASLGSKYSITRERVRQIEAAALKSLAKIFGGNTALSKIHARCVEHLKTMGGIRRTDIFANDLKLVLRDDETPAPYVELVFAALKTPLLYPESDEYFSFWYTGREALSNVQDFVSKVAKALASKKETVVERGAFDTLFYGVVKNHRIGDFVGLNYLLISKLFSVNPFGDFGLSQWREIVPKTVRDKAYLVLKKRHAPLHFRSIAEEINRVRFDAKKAHPQTVHNELIKDRRFVLVGRGLYSLKEFGIEEGTTAELLKKLLRKHGPTDTETLVRLVSQQRILKRNTILLNLSNRKHFKKLSDGRYHVA